MAARRNGLVGPGSAILVALLLLALGAQASAQTAPSLLGPPQTLGTSGSDGTSMVSSPSGAHPSAATADVLKMAAAGVGSDVLLAYVRGSKAPFDLSADDIIALTQAKVEPQVIQAMLERDAALRPSAAPAVADQAANAPAIGASATAASSPGAASPALNPDPAAAPAPLVQLVPASPGPDYAWAPGYWSWNGDGWVWVYGYWHRPRFWWGWGWHRRHW
ncbi:MAG: YXWGXW repeat-containing protein [Treponema sp.]|nr:YXWGXW repeat-containing protein [Treponema sp.]